KKHQCTICLKRFPRPSGLKTHMNMHSGVTPFKCLIPTCSKTFGVRSNATRHLRTHGILPSKQMHEKVSLPRYTGFPLSIKMDVQEAGKLPSMSGWVPASLSTRT
ncbi:hypothetical protein C8Q80DRAFT_1053815, partial [Daedaleopsis nitida]